MSSIALCLGVCVGSCCCLGTITCMEEDPMLPCKFWGTCLTSGDFREKFTMDLWKDTKIFMSDCCGSENESHL